MSYEITSCQKERSYRFQINSKVELITEQSGRYKSLHQMDKNFNASALKLHTFTGLHCAV